MTPRRSNDIPFYNPLDPSHQTEWPGYNLLMPVCAVGNIGQLACDLIIATLLGKRECQLVGRIYSPAIMSVVGPNAFFDEDGPLTTSTEVYESKLHKLIIIQQRTSYYKNMKHIYVDELTKWIHEAKFKSLYVLTSSFAECNPDISQLGVFCPAQSMATSSFQPDNQWNELKIKQIPASDSNPVIKDGLSFLPGSGITKSLKLACEKLSISAAFIVNFCSEGINMQECYHVANLCNKLFSLFAPSDSTSCKWTEPVAWRRAVDDNTMPNFY